MGIEKYLIQEIKQVLLLQSKEVLTLKEFALYLGISIETAYKLSSKRALTFYRQGKHLYVKREDVIAFLLSNPVKSISEIEKEVSKHYNN